MVPRSDRHPHPGPRGRQSRRLVRRELSDLQGSAPRATRIGCRPAAPHSVQVAHTVSEGENDPMAEILLTESDRGIVRLTLNRPEKRNALSFELLRRLEQAIADIGADPSARVVVLGS